MKRAIMLAVLAVGCTPPDALRVPTAIPGAAGGPDNSTRSAAAGTQKYVTWSVTRDGYSATYDASRFAADDGWATLGCFAVDEDERQTFLGQSATQYVEGGTVTIWVVGVKVPACTVWVQCDLLRTPRSGFTPGQQANQLDGSMMIGSRPFDGPGVCTPTPPPRRPTPSPTPSPSPSPSPSPCVNDGTDRCIPQ